MSTDLYNDANLAYDRDTNVQGIARELLGFAGNATQEELFIKAVKLIFRSGYVACREDHIKQELESLRAPA